MFDFIGWEKQEGLITMKGPKRLDHKIGFRNHTNGHGSDITISSDLIKEVGAKRFDLFRRRDVYALVPNNNGNLYIGKDQNRLSGIGLYAITEIATTCGITMTTNVQHIDGIVRNGAIIFPAENYFNNGWKEEKA